jgi:hypothetical protein
MLRFRFMDRFKTMLLTQRVIIATAILWPNALRCIPRRKSRQEWIILIGQLILAGRSKRPIL